MTSASYKLKNKSAGRRVAQLVPIGLSVEIHVHQAITPHLLLFPLRIVKFEDFKGVIRSRKSEKD